MVYDIHKNFHSLPEMQCTTSKASEDKNWKYPVTFSEVVSVQVLMEFVDYLTVFR